MARTVLIDGYNVIGADPVLSRLQGQSLEAARAALLQAVAGSPRFLGDSVIVIFDGQGAGVAGRRVGQVSAFFSNPGSTADDVIKARAAAARDRASVVVVTNDQAIRDHCRQLGCAVSTSENLLEQLATPRKLKRPREAPDSEDEPETRSSLSTVRKGNPRRRPKSARRKPTDVRF